jgi:phenylalanyl-tRNA synthetase beta chain
MLNPLSQELDVMRQSLIFSSLEAVAHNQNRQTSDIRLFEFGKTYQKIGENYKENKRLLIAISGKKLNEQWNNSSEKSSFFTLKGISFAILERLGLENFLTENPISESLLEDGVELSVLKQAIGQIGWVSSKMKKHFGIKQDVFIADLDWDALIAQLKLVKINYKELPKTFEVRRDFSLLLDTAINYQSIEKIALGVDRKILKRVNLFDVYEGKNLDEGKKSYAVSFYFQDNEQTLKDEQIEKVMLKIKSELESKLNAQLR